MQQVQFGPIHVEYDDEVLEPRPWTIEQSRWAAALLDGLPGGPVLELCAGAGQIGLVAALETGRQLVQIDADDRACTHARRNAARAGVTSDVRCGDLHDVLADRERFPLVLADPPYIPNDEVDRLPEDPRDAIDGGGDGLEVARTCIAVAAAHVVAGGLVLLQLGSPDQAEALGTTADEHDLAVVETRAVGTEGVLMLLRRRG